jgi:hypothetical protein
MATVIGVRSLARRGIRIQNTDPTKTKLVKPDATAFIDVDDPKTRRDVAHHSAIGQLVVVRADGTGTV